MSKRNKIKGTPAPQSFQIPLCSTHKTRCVRNDVGEWVCLECADEWLEHYVANKVGGKSIGGVVLPSGAKDERRAKPSFRDLLPNSAARRAARREHARSK